MDFSSFKGFEWDIGNIAKVQNRLDLATVEFAFKRRPYVAFDADHSEFEKRWNLVNKVNERFLFIVFTIRGDKIRVISSRYMRRREVRFYEDWFREV